MSDLEKFNVSDIKGLKKIKKHTWVVEFKPLKKKKDSFQYPVNITWSLKLISLKKD